MENEIWVFIEEFAGKPKVVSLELLGKGRELADSRQAKLVAVIIGKQPEEIGRTVISYGADRALIVADAAYEHYSTDGHTYVLEQLIRKYQPLVLLIGATPNGRDLGGRLSNRLEVGLVADSTDCYFKEGSDQVQWVRPAYTGKLFSRIVNTSRPQLATIGSSIFRGNQPDENRKGDVMREELPPPAGLIRTSMLEFVPVKATEDETLALEKAQTVVAVGRGIDKEEQLPLIWDFAESIGAAWGVSKPLVDAGWVPADRQIGVTGKRVAPKIYIALGISGAIQHTLGIKDAGLIIAVNTDPQAPIFKTAHYGIVGDLFQAVPVLKEEFAKLKRLV